jgi:hypothetical protein
LNATEPAVLVIPEAFRGPPKSGNGGYVCGRVARHLAPAPCAEVTLRSPPPLDLPMSVEHGEDGVRVHRGETLVAEGRVAELDLEAPAAPDFETAAACRGGSPALWEGVNTLIAGTGVHPVCVCCGEELTPDLGLRIQAAPVPGFEGVAASWIPHPAFDDGSGRVAPEILWTALDCPGQFAFLERDAEGTVLGHALLGRFTVRIDAPVDIGERCVVTGWRLAGEGRKFEAGTALFGADGRLRAIARALWIRFDPESLRGS